MKAPLVVRALEPSEATAVLEVARSLPRWFNASGLKQMEEDVRSHQGFLAVRGERVLGFATWCPLLPEVANLSWMGVVPEEHRRGIGSALLSSLIRDLAARGFRELEVSTVADSVDYPPYVATRAFYRSRGFSVFAVDEGYYGSEDDRYARLRMRLTVRIRG